MTMSITVVDVSINWNEKHAVCGLRDLASEWRD